MFERFIESSRQAVVIAQETARMLGDNHIGSEHLLIALAKPDVDPGTAQLLADYGADYDRLFERQSQQHLGEIKPLGQIPFTPTSKMVLEFAHAETVSRTQDKVLPDHLLFALLAERFADSAGQALLRGLGVNTLALRNELSERVAAIGAKKLPPRPVDLSEQELELAEAERELHAALQAVSSALARIERLSR